MCNASDRIYLEACDVHKASVIVGAAWANICIPMCSSISWFIFGNCKRSWMCKRVRASYLFKMRNGGLPPAKLELLVNVVLQALTHAALLVRWIGFQAEQAVTLLETDGGRERRKKKKWGLGGENSRQLAISVRDIKRKLFPVALTANKRKKLRF